MLYISSLTCSKPIQKSSINFCQLIFRTTYSKYTQKGNNDDDDSNESLRSFARVSKRYRCRIADCLFTYYPYGVSWKKKQRVKNREQCDSPKLYFF